MITLKSPEFKGNTSKETGLIFIDEDGYYEAQLMAIRYVKEDEKFAKDDTGNPREPRDQYSLLFDIKVGELRSHVATKPMTMTFSDKSLMPKFWEKAFTMKSVEDFVEKLYDGDTLKPIACKVNIVTTTKGDKTYARVEAVSKLLESGFKGSAANVFDTKVFGKDAIDVDFAKGYTLANNKKETKEVPPEGDSDYFASEFNK